MPKTKNNPIEEKTSVPASGKLPLVILGVILLVAAYLRLYKIPEYMTFLGDEGRDMLVVLHMIVNHKFTLLGPTASVGGFFLGPIYYYFMLPFVWLFGLSPVGAAVMVALFGIATVYLMYRAGRDMFGEQAGLTAAALYALSPVVIAYSRSSWNPNLVPFFALTAMYLSWKSIGVKKPVRYLFGVGVALGVGLQLHYLFLFLFPVVGLWYALYGRARRMIVPYLSGIAGFVVGYGLFLAFELRHGFPNTLSIIRFLLSGKGTGFVESSYTAIIGNVLYRLFGRLVYRLPPPEQMATFTRTTQNLWNWGLVAAIVLSLLAVIFLLAVRLRERDRKSPSGAPAAVLLLLWLAVPLLLFGLYKKGIYDYYFGIFFPVPFFVTAIALRTMSVKKAGLYAAIVLTAILSYWNWMGRPFLIPPNNQLGQMRMIAREAIDKTDGKPFNFALITGGNSDHAYRYFFELWQRAPVTIENEAVDPARKTVTDQLIVICEQADCKPLGNSLWEIAGFGRAEIVGQWQAGFVTIYRLGHYKEQSK